MDRINLIVWGILRVYIYSNLYDGFELNVPGEVLKKMHGYNIVPGGLKSSNWPTSAVYGGFTVNGNYV